MSVANQDRLWLIWRSKNPERRRRFRIGTLTFDKEKNVYTFQYDSEYKDAVENGFDFYPGFKLPRDTFVSKGVLFQNIVSRLPNKEREDYIEILNRYGLNSGSSDFDILKGTKGRLVTDNFEFVPPFDDSLIVFDVAGLRHRDREKINEYYKEGILKENAKLTLVHDCNNEYDKNAIKIYLDRKEDEKFIGYVPRYYNERIAGFLDKNVAYSALVKSIDLEASIPDERVSVEVKLILSPDIK